MFLSLIFFFAFAGMGYSQSPDAVNYQAIARDGSGVLLANQSLTVRIGVYSGVGGATKIYEETHSLTTNQFGLFSLKIGTGTVLSGTFSTIGWGDNEHHFMVEVDDGVSGFVDLGKTQFLSVPYALHAGEAQWKTNGSSIYYSTGYVGIGTATPSAGLDIESSAGYGSALSLNNTSTNGIDWRMTSWTDGTFRVVKTSGSTFSPLVIEPVDGHVGIGTSTPNQQLSVHTNSGISYIRVSDNTTGPASGLRMGLSGSGNAYIINDEATKSLSLGTSGTTQVRITDAGHVGINKTSPGMMLHIKQDVSNKGLRIEHNSATDYWDNGIGVSTKNYKFFYNNSNKADIASVDGSYTQISDRRLKNDIQYMPSVLSKVAQLKPATYYYNDNKDYSIRSTGFVAQEVEAVFPDLVRDMEGGYKGVVYDGFAVISIKAIQELNDKITKMQEEINALKEAVKD